VGGWPGTHEQGVSEAKARPSGGSTTTTTPFDVLTLKDMAFYHLAMDVIVVSRASDRSAAVRQLMQGRGAVARAWTREHGEVLPEVAGWT